MWRSTAADMLQFSSLSNIVFHARTEGSLGRRPLPAGGSFSFKLWLQKIQSWLLAEYSTAYLVGTIIWHLVRYNRNLVAKARSSIVFAVSHWILSNRRNFFVWGHRHLANPFNFARKLDPVRNFTFFLLLLVCPVCITDAARHPSRYLYLWIIGPFGFVDDYPWAAWRSDRFLRAAFRQPDAGYLFLWSVAFGLSVLAESKVECLWLSSPSSGYLRLDPNSISEEDNFLCIGPRGRRACLGYSSVEIHRLSGLPYYALYLCARVRFHWW